MSPVSAQHPFRPVMEEVFNSLIPSLVEGGVFGDVTFLNIKSNDETDLGAQFGSTISFVNLKVRESSGEKVFPLVIKLPFIDLIMRKDRDSSSMFYNEVIMYSEIIPGLQVDENLYPKYYYGIVSDGPDSENDIIILENLKFKDFVLSKKKVFLDFDHISLAIKNIAKFHSFSYIMKHKSSDKFYELAKKLKPIETFKNKLEENRTLALTAYKRGFKQIMKNGVDNMIVEDFISCFKYPEEIKELLSFPEEPFAVICHGDFCNNNVLYRYDSNGKPIDCAFFDFQLSLYGSPAIDLFFYLYMHTTSQTREKYWDSILKLYWDTLRSNVPDHIDIPSFQEYLQHLACRAVYGYTICSWFLPILVIENPLSLEEYQKMNLEEKVSAGESLGGERCDLLVGEVASHLLNKGYIHAFIEFCKEKGVIN